MMDGTDRLYNSAIHLISPPPEETLRRVQRPSSPPAAKRKRSVVVEPVTTPNPRSRKQLRENDPAPQSPTRPSPSPTPNPLLSVRSRRSRSATPIPPYEPPTDVFTPPKLVVVSPSTATVRVSKSSKRKSATKKKRTPTPIVVKLEMPDIDLTAPMPPPSPGDDPLLLTGPTSSPTMPRGPAFSESDLFDIHNNNKHTTPSAPVRRTTSPAPAAFIKKLRFDDLPPSSPPQQNIISSPMLDVDDDQPADIPFFDLNAWSDSDSDDLPILSEPVSEPQDGEGDYTGKWKDVFIKTKADDPPELSREERWPFPLSLEKAPPFALVHQEKDVDDQMNVEPDPFDFSSIPDDEPLPQGRQMSPELGGEVEQEREHFDAEDAFRLMGNQPEKHNEEIEPSVLVEEEIESSPEPVELSQQEHDSVEVDQQSESASDEEQQSLEIASDEEQQALKVASDEEQQSLEDATDEEQQLLDVIKQQPPEPTLVRVTAEEDDDNSSNSSDADDEPDIVKITSADPRAAARAAAILKQHNYDCFTRRELKRRYSDATRRRRFSSSSSGPFELARAVFEGGVRKGNSHDNYANERRRRRTVGGMMGVRGEDVFIPGSPVMTLPDLLREKEVEVSMEEESPNNNPFKLRNKSDRNPFKTPLPNRNGANNYSPLFSSGPLSGLGLMPKVPMTPGETCFDPLTGERMWTKEEWKRLDACFTDERLEVGARLGLGEALGGEQDGLASVDLVDLENVLRRFVEWMGGEEAVAEYGPDWSRENLMQRTRALRRKQRKGQVAPPTTLPFSPMSPASPWSFASKTVGMEVPEFTPIRPKPLRKREWISHVPVDTEETPLHSRIEGGEGKGKGKIVPPTLLAPRYSHLLEEAISISRELPKIAFPPDNVGMDSLGEETVVEEIRRDEHEESDGSPSTLVEDSEFMHEQTVVSDVHEEKEKVPQETIGKRVKGMLFSYLPTLKKPSTTGLKRPGRPGLPLPPQDVLDRRPRGPVVTPAREPLPKVVPPKEMVTLQQAPPVVTPSAKMEKVVHPKELVELNHVTPKVVDEEERRRRERRRSSGAGSVKDLIKGFEGMERRSGEQEEREGKGKGKVGGGEVRRMKSVGEWRRGVNGGRNVGEDGKRPIWKF